MAGEQDTETEDQEAVVVSEQGRDAPMSPRTVGSIENPDLQKMRKLAIILSLILFTYSVAALEIDINETISILGIPLKISNPNLLGIGLFVANMYALLRFILYGLVKNLSPRRFRKVLCETTSGNDYSDYIYELFPGESRNGVIRELNEAFPTLGDKGVGIVNPDTDEEKNYVEFKLPAYTRVLAFFHDLDYSAPIWFSLIALATWLFNFTSLKSIWPC